jgi:hypothetical protein
MNEPSRAVALKLDERAMTATLAREYVHPDRFFAIYQGNVQALPNGNVFVGWGSSPVVSEFGEGGDLLFDAEFPPENETYRAFRFPWRGEPRDAPALVAESGPQDEVTLYASWNGATEVESWQVLSGPEPGELEPVGSAARKGFETVITLQTPGPYVAVEAKDRSGRVLGVSGTIKPGASA